MSNPKTDGGPAFPVIAENGVTLRDWFAGQALVSMITKCGPMEGFMNELKGKIDG